MAGCFAPWILFVGGVAAVSMVPAAGSPVFPESSQEGPLRRFHSYGDVTLFHYAVPGDVSIATWQFAAFVDSRRCEPRDVHVYLQHGSFPVMSPTNATFPENLYTGRTELRHVTARAAFEPHDATVVGVNNPLPGNWFAAAFISRGDQHVRQQGLGHKCRYSLGSVALWTQVAAIPVVSAGTARRVTTMERYSYYKMFIAAGTWHFSVRLSAWDTERPCLLKAGLRARALPSVLSADATANVSEASELIVSEAQPYTDSFYYLLVVSDREITFTVELTTTECPVRGAPPPRTPVEEDASVSIQHSDWADTILSNTSLISEHEWGMDTCLPTFKLARIKQTRDFADTFLLQASHTYTPFAALTDDLPLLVQLHILPFVDTGGTLSVKIAFNGVKVPFKNASTQEVHIKGCIRKGRPPALVGRHVTCPPQLALTVTSLSSPSDDIKLIPFPEPDVWFVALEASCQWNGSVQPCAAKEVMVSLDIRTQPCVFDGRPCGDKGVCQQSHKGLHFFTSCACLAGYTGWACTDGSHAPSDTQLLATTLLLTLSNVFFVPAVLVALKRRLWSEAVVYVCTMVCSVVYHLCDEDWYGYCITRYEVLQFCDFLCSILAFWVTLIALAGIPIHVSSPLHLIGVLVIAMGVEYDRTALIVFIVPFAVGVVVTVMSWMVRCWRIGRHGETYRQVLPGVALAAIGLSLFAFIETEDNYQYVHSAWHVTMALSLVWLLPRETIHRTPTLSAGDAEMLDVNERGSPVFVVSDVDTLLG